MPIDWLKSLRKSPARRRFLTNLGNTDQLEIRSLLSAVSIGPEARINGFTTGNQSSPSVAVDADGDYAVVWRSAGQDGDKFGIFGQLYTAAGNPRGSQFQVNTNTVDNQSFPSIAMDSDGDFIVTWQSWIAGSDYEIYARRYNAAGTPLADEFHVNAFTTNAQTFPVVASDDDGDFVIAWQSYSQDGSSWGVYAKRFDSTGTPQGSEFKVNTYNVSHQTSPAIDMDADGDFVITWQSNEQDNDRYGVYAQRYSAAGLPQGSEFLVNSYTNNHQNAPSIALDAAGNFVIVWQSLLQNGDGNEIYGRMYLADGTPTGGEFLVNLTISNFQFAASVSMNSTGDFVVAWTSNFQDGSAWGVFARQFDFDGMYTSPEYAVNTYTTLNQYNPSVALDSDGDFVIAWHSVDQDGSDYGVYGQRFRSSHGDQLASRRNARFYLDSNGSDVWNGPSVDTYNPFGLTTDKPLVGDWNGDAYTDIGIWRNGYFYLDTNGNGIWEGGLVDARIPFGISTDTPLVGDWNGDGIDDLGVWRNGKFFLDTNGNRVWDVGVDEIDLFGSTMDTPVIGDWNGDGIDDLGVRREGVFYLDLIADRHWNVLDDGAFTFGNVADIPVIGDWNSDGIDDLGVWRAGKFYRDVNGNRFWDVGLDTVTKYGNSTDIPLVGYWRPLNLPGFPTASAGLLTTASAPLSASLPITSAPSELTLASLIAPPAKKSL